MRGLVGYRLRDSSYRPFNRSPLQARKISFKIINSTTLLLPRWREHVANTAFKDRVLPRDVATRWNSTYDMLAAFLEMKEPVSQFLDRSSNRMAEFLLDNDEWTAIEGLVSALKVCHLHCLLLELLTSFRVTDSQRCNNIFFFQCTYCSCSHSCYGCY